MGKRGRGPTSHKIMSLRDAYREKIEAQLQAERASLDLLKAKARLLAADGKILAYEELADAEHKFESTKARLKELGTASEGAFEELKLGVEGAWTSLSQAAQNAADKFKSP
jgi:hypothetical protein